VRDHWNIYSREYNNTSTPAFDTSRQFLNSKKVATIRNKIRTLNKEYRYGTD
jgi:hypothetical protein